MFGRKRMTPEQEYRIRRQKDILELFDSWVIEKVRVNGERAFLPHPLWDNEWLLTRDSFETEAEALAEVERNGGKLLEE